MSDLWRIVDPENTHLLALILNDQAVPVTIDYEAARYAAPTGCDLMYDSEIKAIIDAALNVEEDS